MSDQVEPRPGRSAAIGAIACFSTIVLVWIGFVILQDQVRSQEVFEAHGLVGPFMLSAAATVPLAAAGLCLSIAAAIRAGTAPTVNGA